MLEINGGLHEFSVAIGELQTEMRLLSERVKENQELSTAEHRDVHNIVVAMSESVRNIARDVLEMKPLTEDYREKRAEARGAARIVNLLYAFAGGSIAVAFGKVLEYLNIRPHP